MNNCILLPIEAESQETALRIFSTLNNRGRPLSDADIFKAQFYKFYSRIDKKVEFIDRWKELEELCEKFFHPNSGSPMDELFTRYMYFVRAKKGIKNSTTEGLRKFYEQKGYELFQKEETFNDLFVLGHFWKDVFNQGDRFSPKILRKLFVLNYAPNSMWTYLVSVYFMQNRDGDGNLEEEAFAEFLDKITGFIWTYAVTNPGVSSLRAPVFAEMVNIINKEAVAFSGFLFDVEKVKSKFNEFDFTNNRAITRSMLAWWAFTDQDQVLLPLGSVLEIEHIYARNRQDKENSLSNSKNIDALGNKVLLEGSINIRASDYRFVDKKKYYNGYTNSKGWSKEGTKIQELVDLAASTDDFTESDIIARTEKIMSCFVVFLKNNGLTTNETAIDQGRPKGSENKKTQGRETETVVPKRRGRPKGSKNKKTIERERLAAESQGGENQ